MPLKDQLNQWKTKLENINREHNLLPFGQGRPPPSQHTQQGQYQYQQPPYPHYPQQQQQQQQQYYPGQQAGYASPPPQQYAGSQNTFAPPPSQQQQHYNRPPPIPQHSHPNAQAPYQTPQPVSQRYWTARFDPTTPVSAEWDQKEGNNNGWGNAELENYTRNAENSF